MKDPFRGNHLAKSAALQAYESGKDFAVVFGDIHIGTEWPPHIFTYLHPWNEPVPGAVFYSLIFVRTTKEQRQNWTGRLAPAGRVVSINGRSQASLSVV